MILTVKFSLNSLSNWALIPYLSLSFISVPSAKFLVYPSLLCDVALILNDVLSEIGPVIVPAIFWRLYSPAVIWTFPPKLFSGRAVVIFITPARAFLPNKVDCGPLITSTLSILIRSLIAAWFLEIMTPSIEIATDGSTPGLLAPFPKPRIWNVFCAANCCWLICSEGTELWRSSKSLIASLSISSIWITDTDTGVSCNVVSFLVDVTTISSISLDRLVCACKSLRKKTNVKTNTKLRKFFINKLLRKFNTLLLLLFSGFSTKKNLKNYI